MTNKEGLLSVVGFAASDSTLEKALVDNDATASDTYSKANAQLIDKAAILVLESLLSTPDQTEGGYSVKYDRIAVKARLERLTAKIEGTTVGEPTISDASNLW